VTKVYADIEPIVIPFGFVVAAPLPIGVHPGDVLVHLTAVLAMSCGVVVNSGSIRFKPALAIAAPVSIGASRTADSEYKRTSKHTRKNRSTPKISAHRSHLHGDRDSVFSFTFDPKSPHRGTRSPGCGDKSQQVRRSIFYLPARL
jgi:hypothetical protein